MQLRTVHRLPARARMGSLFVAGAAAIIAAGATLGTRSASADTGPKSAEADGYVVQGQASLLGSNLSKTPIQIGPISQSFVSLPPGTTGKSHNQVLTFNSNGQQPLLDYLNAATSRAAATLGSEPSTDCASPPHALTTGFNGGPLTGANACTAVAQVGVLNAGTADKPMDVVQAAAVESQSLTQSCSTKPEGHTNIARLSIGGTDVIGGNSPLLGTDTPSPNTEINLGIVQVILNEQHFDNQGHGLTVNAIHVFTAAALGPLVSVDIVIGHSHSEALCAQGTTNTGTTPGNGTLPLPVVTKTDSTKHANPGEVVTYSVSIDPKGCDVTRVTDILPATFTFISASGNLGAPVVGTVPGGSQQTLTWFSPTGLTPPLTETINVQVPTNAAPGLYINNVEGQSAVPISSTPTSGCGEFQGSDLLPLTSGPPENQGNNPGIIVPRTGQTTGTVSASTTSGAPGPKTPNTSADTGSVLAAILPLMAIMGTPAAARRLRRRRMR